MQIPIRIIGVATSVFWVFLIIFSLTAAYSMKDFQFNIGQPQISTTQDNMLLFSFPVSIVNTGLYNIAHFNVSTTIFSKEGKAVAQGSTFVPVVEHGQAVNTNHTMMLNLTDLLQRSQSLVLNDTELAINAMVGMRAAEVVPVQASSNFTMPWGAPLSNLVLSSPQFTAHNATHARVAVTISFQNHAFFDVIGSLQLKMYNAGNVVISQGQTQVEVSQHSTYNGSVELGVPLLTASRGSLEVLFSTQFFNYGPLVIPYG